MEMKLGGDLERAARASGRMPPAPHPGGPPDLRGGRVARHFLLMAGIGLDAQIVYHVSAPLKARIGKLAYWLAGWSLLGRRLPDIFEWRPMA